MVSILQKLNRSATCDWGKWSNSAERVHVAPTDESSVRGQRNGTIQPQVFADQAYAAAQYPRHARVVPTNQVTVLVVGVVGSAEE